MKHTEPQQPFFVRFLESQQKNDTNSQLTSPLLDVEPSHPFKDGPYTDKYPSDGDEDWA